MSSLPRMTDRPARFIAHRAEWKLQHKLITVPLIRGRVLTLSHEEQCNIYSPGVVRGICVVIFPRRNYCQSADCYQGMNREREGGRVLPTVSEQHL